MHPLLLTFLIFGVPAAIALVYIFVRGTSAMRRYIVTRIALTVPMVIILATLVFFVMRILPGDPVTSALGPKGSPEVKELLRENLGLNDPLLVQYGRFLGNMLTFDFGESLIGAHRPISDELGERLPATLGLIDPLLVQYGRFLGNMLSFDFGESLIGAHRPISDELGERLPATLELI